jgi:hypothetical protein
MSASALAVMKLAGEEAERLGQDYIGDEHVLLGLLRHGGGPAAALLTEAGATLAGARAALADLQARGLTPGSYPGSPQALQALGISADEIRQRLTAAFGAEAVAAAVRRCGGPAASPGGVAVGACERRCAGRRCSPIEPCISPPSTPALAGTSARSSCCTACCVTSPTLPELSCLAASRRT